MLLNPDTNIWVWTCTKNLWSLFKTILLFFLSQKCFFSCFSVNLVKSAFIKEEGHLTSTPQLLKIPSIEAPAKNYIKSQPLIVVTKKLLIIYKTQFSTNVCMFANVDAWTSLFVCLYFLPNCPLFWKIILCQKQSDSFCSFIKMKIIGLAE